MAVGFIDICIVGSPLLLLYVLKTYFHAQAVWEQFRAIPGRRTLISEFSLAGKSTGEVKYITPGWDKGWVDKHKEHRVYGWDVISSVALWPIPQGGLVAADAHAIKTILSSRQRFPKPLRHYKILRFFGDNVLASEFDEWKRHRRIAAPAFGEKNRKLAFGESVRAVTSLYEGEWRNEQEIIVDDVAHLTLGMALMAISAAGFGYRINREDDKTPPGHSMSFKRSIDIAGDKLFVRLLCPNWLFQWAPTKQIREVRDGLSEFRSYLVELINARKLSNEKDEKWDLLSNLVSANEEVLDTGEERLSEEELIGNAFMFYVAGHGSTGNAVAFALNMLAVHQEEQEALSQHIQGILPDTRLPTYADIPKLNKVTATLYETLRMFPITPVIPKYSAEDTSLVVGNQSGDTTVLQVPAGTEINIDVTGLHYNPRYWEDPFTFKPERFLGEWNKDAFIPFSGGARACIGRGFFETSSLAILTILIQHFRVEPHPKFSGEPFESLKERYSQAKSILTLMPLCSSLVFKRRK